MDIQIIQLNDGEAVFARFRRERDRLLFLDGSRHDCADRAKLAGLIASHLLPQAGASRIILSLPPTLLTLREMALPITDRRKLREILPLELRGETALDSDELACDAVPLAEGVVLAAWSPREAVADLIRFLADNGVEPEVVTAAFLNWADLLPPPGDAAITDGSAMAVFQGGKQVFCRTLPSAAPSELARTLNALELGKGLTVATVFTIGAAARQEPSGETMPKVTPLPMDGPLAETFATDQAAARDLAGAFATARAVCFGAPLDLRNGPLAYTRGHEKLRKRLRLTAILAAAVIILLFAEAGLRWFLVKRDLDSLNGSIRTIYKDVFPGRTKPVDEVAELKAEIRRLGSSSGSGGVLAALKLLADAKGDDVTGIVETDLDGNQLRIKGDARSAQAVNDFKARLKQSFASLEVGEIKSRPDNSVAFSLRGTLKEGGK